MRDNSGRAALDSAKMPDPGREAAMAAPRRGSARAFWTAALLAAAYAATAKAGFLVAVPPGNVTSVWPPSGIALAALLILGPGAWPGIGLGSLIANLWFFNGLGPALSAQSWAASLIIAAGSTVQALLAAFLVRRWAAGGELTRPETVFRFAALVGAACVTAATVGVAALWALGFLAPASFGWTWLTWWLGDAMGALLIAPPLLALGRFSSRSLTLEASAACLLSAAAAGAVFWGAGPGGGAGQALTFLIFPLVFWGGLRLKPGAAAFQILVIAASAIGGTAAGLGPFSGLETHAALLLLQLFLASAAMTGLVLSAAVTEARQAHEALESRVGDRTRELEQVNRSLRLSEEALQERTRELARSNLELNEFALVASHDLQSPLRKITAFGDRLLESLAPTLDPENKDFLNRMVHSAQRLDRLIQDLLQLAQVNRQTRPMTAVRLDAELREVLADLEEDVAASGAKVEAGPLPPVRGDAVQIRQLLGNLLSNALKFQESGRTPRVRISGRARGDGFVEIVVEDNGVGFDPEQKDLLFKPFQRLHGHRFRGSGMGLAICARIALRHGGTLAARGVPGRGAAFTVTLPAAGEERP